MRRCPLIFLGVTTAVGIAAAQTVPNGYPVKPVPLADSAEVSLAVSAAPREVSAQATVYAVRDGRLVTLRRGTNGAACMVARDLHAGSLYPICFNAEGARTVLPREVMEVRLRSLGASEDSVKHAVAAAYARGALQPPRAMAIAYMMSPHQVLFSAPGPEGRRVGAWHPHLMFYIPGATPGMFALEEDGAGEPIAFSSPGTPQAEVIVKVPKWADGSPAVVK